MADAPTFTDVQVMEALAAAVAEKGDDYVYRKKMDAVCLYVHDEGGTAECPGCIVGDTLHRLGVPLSKLSKYEGHSAMALAGWAGVFIASPAAVMALDAAQREQDDGDTWGEALGAAHAAYSGVSGKSLWPDERPHF